MCLTRSLNTKPRATIDRLESHYLDYLETRGLAYVSVLRNPVHIGLSNAWLHFTTATLILKYLDNSGSRGQITITHWQALNIAHYTDLFIH